MTTMMTTWLCEEEMTGVTYICGSTITDEQQQHEMVTTTTTEQSLLWLLQCLLRSENLHKLLSVQELISPIHILMYDLPLQQLNMK